MPYAVRHGLSGAAILGRTRGNTAGLAFYALYVLAIAVRAPIGLRTLCQEWLGWRAASLNWFVAALALALEFLPWRGWQQSLLAWAAGAAFAAGLAFAL